MTTTLRLLSLALAIVLGAVLTAPATLAQDAPPEQTTTEPPVEQAPAEPKAIAPSEIASKSVEAKVKLRKLREDLGTSAEVRFVVDELPDVAERMGRLESVAEARPLHMLPLPQLEEILREWTRQGDLLEEWSGQLLERSTHFGETIAALEFHNAVWRMTGDSAAAQGLPEGSIKQISLVHGEIAKAERDIRELRQDLLELQSEVSDRDARVRDAVDAIKIIVDEKRQRIFKIDNRPLWSAAGDSLVIAGAVGDTRDRLTGDVWEFVIEYRDRLILHVVVILALVIGMLFLQRQAPDWDADDELLNAARQVIRRPLSATLTVSLLFIRFVYPLAPLSIYELAAILVLFPLALLVPKLLPSGFVKPTYGLFILFFLNRVLILGPETDLSRRVDLLAITVLALVGAIWWLWRGASAARLTRPWSQITRWVGWIGVVMLSTSAVCNTIGAVGFADLMTRGIVGSAFLGVLLYVSTIVVQAGSVVLLRSRIMQSLQSVRKNTFLIRRRTVRVLAFAAWLGWFSGSLRWVRLWDPISEELVTFLRNEYTLGSLSISVAGVFGFFLTIWVAILVSRFIRFILNDDVLPRMPLARGVPPTILMLVNYTIISIGFIMALAAAGIKLGQFAIIAGGLGVGIGFGLQSMVNNFVSGLILLFERPVQLGDTIEVGTLMGTVKRIGIRASTVRTFSGADVIVPNGDILNLHVTNWTLSDMLRRIEIKVGVAYGTDPQTVLDLLVETALKHDKALTSPEPFALFLGFGDSSLDFEVRFWTSHYDQWLRIGSDVTVAINNALKEKGIEIPFPQRDLHIKSVAEPAGDALADRRKRSEEETSN